VKDAAEATVQRSSGTLAGLRPTLEAAPAGLLVIDAEGTIHLANTRVQEIGPSRSELDSDLRFLAFFSPNGKAS